MAQLTASDIFTDSRDPGTNVNPKVLGSLWINYNTGEQFVCKDNTLNKNVWVSTTKKIQDSITNIENNFTSKLEEMLDGGMVYSGIISSTLEKGEQLPGTSYWGLYPSININGFDFMPTVRKSDPSKVFIYWYLAGSNGPEAPLYDTLLVRQEEKCIVLNKKDVPGINYGAYSSITNISPLLHIKGFTREHNDVTSIEFYEPKQNSFYTTGVRINYDFCADKNIGRDYTRYNIMFRSVYSTALGSYLQIQSSSKLQDKWR